MNNKYDLLINNKLTSLRYKNISIDKILSNKDGIIVFKATLDSSKCVVKYFENKEYRREIDNYKLLRRLNIKTISLLNSTEDLIVLEDIDYSQKYRLATIDDMNDLEVSKALAKWYKLLHQKGKDYLKESNVTLYSEYQYFTKEVFKVIKEKTNTSNLSVWDKIEQKYDLIINKLNSLEKTLTYNDFYYTNLIVSFDKKEAFMFDYNLLGEGYIYSDIRNVLYSLGEDARNAFINEYGIYENELEVKLDNIISVITTLYFASLKETFPSWGKEYLEILKNKLEDYIIALEF